MKSPGFTLYPKDALTDTQLLSNDELAAYVRLWFNAWLGLPGYPQCYLPSDDRSLAALARMPLRQWLRIKDRVLELFRRDGEGRIYHKRLLEELRKQMARRPGKQASGERGAESRWGGGDHEERATRSARLAAARARGTHTRQEWEVLLELVGYRCVRCGVDGGPLRKDHIVPIYLDGSDAIANLQPLCPSCNSSKGPDRTDFRVQALGLESTAAVLECLAKRLAERLAKRQAEIGETPGYIADADEDDYEDAVGKVGGVQRGADGSAMAGASSPGSAPPAGRNGHRAPGAAAHTGVGDELERLRDEVESRIDALAEDLRAEPNLRACLALQERLRRCGSLAELRQLDAELAALTFSDEPGAAP